MHCRIEHRTSKALPGVKLQYQKSIWNDIRQRKSTIQLSLQPHSGFSDSNLSNVAEIAVIHLVFTICS